MNRLWAVFFQNSRKYPGGSDMYKKILVPLDGSHRSEKILPHVEALAKRYGSKVVFLRVVRFPQLNAYNGVETGAYQRNCEEIAESALSQLKLLAGEFREKGMDVDVRVTAGPVVRDIVDMAVTEDVDLITMSSHGRSGFSRVFYGSVAAGVLHQIDRPILMIRSLGSK
jgi:nucleotide-binding universal stress UspA family protein